MRMRLSVSNIGWTVEEDDQIYAFMEECGYCGLEIAPTRIFPEAPYDKLKEAGAWAESLRRKHGLSISSMQSIWSGREERVFGSEKERRTLVEYTKKAIDFAKVVDCDNLVFGCPMNRVITEGTDPAIGINFFKEIGDYAVQNNTVVSIEANPPMYNTNYINDTSAAFELVRQVNSRGILINLDVGTMIQNDESVELLNGKVCYIHHVHISEPGLKPIQKRPLYGKVKELLIAEEYQGYVSIEMRKTGSLRDVKNAIKYTKELFG